MKSNLFLSERTLLLSGFTLETLAFRAKDQPALAGGSSCGSPAPLFPPQAIGEAVELLVGELPATERAEEHGELPDQLFVP